jgi:co-chaperonin GroES (HSP10)
MNGLILVFQHTKNRILVKVKKAAEKSAGGILLAPTMGKQRCVHLNH